MCGITGYLSPHEKISGPGMLARATSLIRHRGPDDEGYALFDLESEQHLILSGSESERDIRDRYPDIRHISPVPHNIGMGFRRFSIVDLTSGGHQPFWDKSLRVCLTFNGEIYNYIELRDELKEEGYIFETRSDSEVLLAAYLHWGVDCLQRLNGPLAVAIYDSLNKRLFLARDRIGKSPLYYSVVNGSLYWASEIKSILHMTGTTGFQVNTQAVYDYIRCGWRDLDHGTFWSHIYTLNNASYALVDVNRNMDEKSFHESVSTYWQFPSRRLTGTDIPLPDACNKFRDIFVDSVRIRLRADANIAFALSGGLDSSAIVGVAAGVLQQPVSTYTVKFREEYADEEPYARQVYEAYRDRIDYNVWSPENTDFWQHADAFVWLEEEPFHSPNLETAQANFRKALEDGFRVLVTGAAGDEALAGYTEYTFPFLRHLRAHGRYLDMLRFVISDSEAKELYPIYFNTLVKRLFHGSGRVSADDNGWHPFHETGFLEVIDRKGPPKEFSPLMIENMGQWKMNYWLRSGNKAIFGIPMESRSPFLDYRLIDFVFSLPPEYLMRNGWRKYILRMSMQGILPESIVWRRRKMGFPFNDREWLDHAEPVATAILRAVSHNPYLDVDKIVARYRELIAVNPSMLWRCISFALWWKRLILNESL